MKEEKVLVKCVTILEKVKKLLEATSFRPDLLKEINDILEEIRQKI